MTSVSETSSLYTKNLSQSPQALPGNPDFYRLNMPEQDIILLSTPEPTKRRSVFKHIFSFFKTALAFIGSAIICLKLGKGFSSKVFAKIGSIFGKIGQKFQSSFVKAVEQPAQKILEATPRKTLLEQAREKANKEISETVRNAAKTRMEKREFKNALAASSNKKIYKGLQWQDRLKTIKHSLAGMALASVGFLASSSDKIKPVISAVADYGRSIPDAIPTLSFQYLPPVLALGAAAPWGISLARKGLPKAWQILKNPFVR